MTFATEPNATSESTIAMEASVAADTENGVEYHFTCTAGGGHNSGWQTSTFYEDSGLVPGTQYTYTVTAKDTSDNCNLNAPSSALAATTLGDSDPPTPATMTWASAPAPNFSNDSPVENLVLPTNGGLMESYTSEYTVGWEAMNLTDGIIYENGWCTTEFTTENPAEDQEFVFSFLDGQEAILNEAIIYSGIADETYYCRDVEVWTSTDGSSFTLADSVVLLEEFLYSTVIDLGGIRAKKIKLVITSGYATDYWEMAEFVVNGYFSVPGDPETEITMTASAASDISDVEYYFTCVSGPGNDRGWQDEVDYTDTGLSPGTEYCYTVTARDKATAQNATAASVVACATTTGCPTCGDLDGSGGDVDLGDLAELARCWGEDPLTNLDCTCANMAELGGSNIDLLDLQVLADLFLSSSLDYPPNCSAP